MALTFAQSKIIVARTIGAANDTDELLVAGDAIKTAIQEWNLRQKWNFLLIDNAAAPIRLIANTHTYQLPTAMREPYTARLVVGTRKTLQWFDHRALDRLVREQNIFGVPDLYTLFRGTNDFSASVPASQAGWIKVFPTPNYTDDVLNPSLYVKYYRVIAEPSVDADYIDVPDRYIYALLAMAKYYYLVDKDAESARTAHHREQSEFLFRKAERDDQEYQDEEIRLIPQIETGAAFGSDVTNLDYWGW